MFWKKTAPVRTAAKPAMSALAMALEPRMMFDGAVAATAAEVADTQATDAQPTADASSSHDNLAATPTGTADNRQEIVFVDGQVQDYQQLLAGIKPGTEVVVLDPKGDGLKQISDYLAGRSGIDAIHIVSHGLPGQVTLGSLTLDRTGLDARSTDLAQIGQSLDVDGDILFYGCDIGSGAAGQAFVNQIAQLTGADVAASDDTTGSIVQGGNWTLEVTRGSIEAVTPFSASAQQAFSGRLFAGTLNFSGPNAVLGTTVTDGQANSTDIPGVVIEIYSANSGNTNSDSPWEYYSDLFNNGTPNAEGIADNSDDGTPTIIIRSQNGAEFSFTGIKIVDYQVMHSQITFEAFRDGISLGSVTLGTDTSDLISDFSQSNGLTASIFQNVDEIRISDPSSADQNLHVALDNIGFADVPRPALVSATFSDNNLKIGETATVTFTFNMAVTGFTTADLTVPNGNISGLSSSDDGLTWTGTFTPNSGVTDSTNVITVDLTGVTSVNGSLAGSGTADSSNYAIDTQAPSVSSVSATTANGHYVAGQTVDITVTFNENVTVTGTPQLTLETGSTDRAVNYLSGSGSNTLTFRYTIQAGDTSLDLDYVSTSALSLNGGSIRDSAGNNATLTLASPGTSGSLGANKAIVIDSAPSIGNLNGDSVGWAGVGNTVALDVAGNATIADAEFGALNSGNGNWSGASLTIQRSGTALASDVLGFNTIGAQFTVSGSNLQSGGQTFATFSNVGGVLTITFTSSGTAATTALVNDVAQRITYRNDTPAGDTTIRYSLNDGNNTVTANVAVTSDTIYVTNAIDTTTVDLNDGVSFSEAIAIALADVTGTQTIVIDASLAGQVVSTAANAFIRENLTLDLSKANGVTLSGGSLSLDAGFTLTVKNDSGHTASIGTSLINAGGLTKTGAGSLTLSGSNAYSGSTVISAGTLEVVGGSALYDLSTVTVASAAELKVTASETIGSLSGSGTVTVDAGQVLTVGNVASTTFSGRLTGTGGLTVSQASGNSYTLTLSGDNSGLSGPITVSNYGRLTVSGDNAIADNAAVTVNGYGTLTLSSNQTIGSLAGADATGSIQLGSYTLTTGGNNSSTSLSASISGTGALIKEGSGTLTLTGNNSYTGATQIDAGGLTLNHVGGALSYSSSVTVASGASLTLSADESLNALYGAGTVALGSNTLRLGVNNANSNFSGAITGSGMLEQDGTGTLTLSGSNSGQNWSTNVIKGWLSISGSSNLGSGRVQLIDGHLSVTHDTTLTNAIVLNGGSGTISVDSGKTVNLTGRITGNAGLNKAGAGTLAIQHTGAVNNTGSVMLNGGTLQLDATVVGAMQINAGTTLTGNGGVVDGTLSVYSGGTVSPGGAGIGSLNVTGLLQMATGSTIIAQINGTVAGTGYDQITVGGIVNLSGPTLAVTHGYTAGSGDTYTLIVNNGPSAIMHSFSGLAEGGTLTAAGNGTTLTASYVGGTGDDFTLTTPIAPQVTGVSSSTANGTYKIGDTITITVSFDSTVFVTGTPQLLLETGAIDRNLDYVSGSGSNTLTFSYTVQAGDISADLDYASSSALNLNGGTIRDSANRNANLALAAPGASGSLGDNKALVIDGVKPVVNSVGVPLNDNYIAGENLDFTVNFSETVTVDTTGGTPRLAITLDTGGTVYASYVSGSGTSALVFRLTIATGQADSNGISVGGAIQANGGTLRDAAGNDAVTTLNSVGDTSGVLVDALPPRVSDITLDGTSPTTNSSVSFTVTFSEDVTGVDLSDFTLATTGSASGTLLSLVQIDARTYRITVGGVTGQGSLGLSLSASGSGIVDGPGNAMVDSYSTVGYQIGSRDNGDPEFRTNPPVSTPPRITPMPQPTVPGAPPSTTTSPLLPPPLFEPPTIGSGIPTLSNIFINNGALAPSYIAQVFASSDSGAGNGSSMGFLGFGGGDGGVFGSSSFSSLFSKGVPQESGEIQLRWGNANGNGLGGGEILGTPTLSQQLQEIGESEQRQIRDLAWALGEIPLQMPQA